MIQRLRTSLPVRVLQAFGASQASNYASALAFNGLLAMFPLMLGILAIIGLSIRDPATDVKFQTLIVETFPGTAQPELIRALHGVKDSAGLLGVISIGGLIWSGSGVFATMEFAFAQILGVPQRDTVRQKVMGFVMMVLLVAAVAVTVGANALAGLLPGAWVVSIAVGAAVMVVLLVLLYRLVPNRTFGILEVLPGALLAGVLIEVLSLAFPLYERVAGGFNTYGAQFALFFLLAAWFYLLSNLVLLGLVYNKFRAGEPVRLGLLASPSHQSRDVPAAHEVIEQKKAEAPPEPPSDHARPRLGRRMAGYVLVGLALVAGLFRRRGSRTIKT
ncbi:MAG TPA: YihY/virulence factor BrkB family protein [Candidatus Dormibacteraeota bacterium]|nr:YihY/virulence factor BrkB family protein [Candidatus Dormibacteraeota bacterium]